jgi:hypothetical protein
MEIGWVATQTRFAIGKKKGIVQGISYEENRGDLRGSYHNVE